MISPKELRSALKHLKSGLLGFALFSIAAPAFAAVVFQDAFNGNSGNFTAAGYVTFNNGYVRLRGGATTSITSDPITITGYTGLLLSYTRSTYGLDYGEAFRAEVSVNGGAFTAIEAVRTASGRVSFPISSASGFIQLRFRISASTYYELADLSNLVLEGNTGSTGGVKLPTSFRWTSSAPLMVAKPTSTQPEVAIKDPTVVYYNGRWHVFSTQAKGNGWNLEYRSFTDWSNASAATPYFLGTTAIGSGYRAAPFVFYHSPSRLWYLVFQNGNAAYSTNPDISNPAGWSAVRTFYSSVPSNVQQDINNGAIWLDFAVACDTVNCHLYSAGDNGKIYRSQTTLANFPNGFGATVVTLQDSNRYNLFEAPQVYKVRETGQYLMIVEAIGSSGRYFRSFTSNSLSGPWTPLAATESNPFAGDANVTFPTGKWSQGISHGEILRTGYDQNLEISACNMRVLYQGLAPGASGPYDQLPYRLGLLTQTNSPC